MLRALSIELLFLALWTTAAVAATKSKLLTQNSPLASRPAILRYAIKGWSPADTLRLEWGPGHATANPLFAERPARAVHADTLFLDEPRLVYLSLKGHADILELLLSPGDTVVLRGHAPGHYARRYKPTAWSGVRVEGGQLTGDYLLSIARHTRLRDSLSHIPAAYAAISRRYSRALALADLDTLRAFAQGTYEEQNYLQMVAAQQKAIARDAISVILSHAATPLGPLYLLRFFPGADERLMPLYRQFAPAARHSYYGRLALRRVSPRLAAQGIAPRLSLLTPELREAPLTFSSAPAHLTLVVFWASYCKPCLTHFPVLATLYDKYHERGLRLVCISTDSDTPEWLHAIEAHHLRRFEHYFDHTHRAPDLFHFSAIPYTLLVDPGGMILARGLHGVELAEYLSTLLE